MNTNNDDNNNKDHTTELVILSIGALFFAIMGILQLMVFAGSVFHP